MFAKITDKKAFVSELHSRLMSRIESTGESEKAFAHRLGSSEALFKNLAAGSLPGPDRLGVLLNEIGETLILGKEPEDSNTEVISLEGLYSRVPVHNAALSAGPGHQNDDAAIIDHLAFRNEWLLKAGVSPKSARAARITGDSMAPAISAGDLVLIDTAKSLSDVPRRSSKDRRPAPIFAFVQDGEARVKRLERTTDRSIVLLSDNPAYPAEVVDPASVDFKLLGQVVWSGHVWR